MNRVTFEPIETNKIYVKVIDQIMALIRNGSLKQGDQLPSEAELTISAMSHLSLRAAEGGEAISLC